MAKKRRARKIDGQWVYHNPVVSLATAPWDHGATGAANRIGLVIEPRGEMDPATGKESNPNRVTGARRVDMLEIYHKRGTLSARAYTAGEMLRVAWLRTEIGTCAPWLRERVDSTPKPDAAVSVQVDRISKLLRVSRLVPRFDERIIHTVVALGVGVGVLPEYRGRRHHFGLEHLSAALERLADALERK